MYERKLPYFPEKCVCTMFLNLHPFNDGRRRKRLHNKILSDANDIVISYEGKIISSISMTIGNALLTIMLNDNNNFHSSASRIRTQNLISIHVS
jgi:hypothetical protein